MPTCKCCRRACKRPLCRWRNLAQAIERTGSNDENSRRSRPPRRTQQCPAVGAGERREPQAIPIDNAEGGAGLVVHRAPHERLDGVVTEQAAPCDAARHVGSVEGEPEGRRAAQVQAVTLGKG
jgi:hypothetical protein